MRRFVYLVALMALVLSACGGSTVSTTSEALDTPNATENPASSSITTTDVSGAGDGTDVAESTTPEETATTTAATDFDGPVAADFSINLAGAGTFTLSEEARPVYLVFWAEW